MTFTVAVLGAECTGKSTLCNALGEALCATVMPETLRDFCELHARAPYANEQSLILQTQINQLRLIKLNKPQFVVMDCTPITTALYSQLYFNDDSLNDKANAFHKVQVDLSLIVEPEFGWQSDSQPWMRDSQHMQERFNALLRHWVLSNPQLPIVQLTGNTNNRVAQALLAIKRLHMV